MTAYDCGKKRAADDAEVEIQVKPTCKPSWQGEELCFGAHDSSFTLVSFFLPSDNHRGQSRSSGGIYGGPPDAKS